MSRPEIIKKLKEKNPLLSKSEIEIILDTFCKSIEIALKQNRNIVFMYVYVCLCRFIYKNMDAYITVCVFILKYVCFILRYVCL